MPEMPATMNTTNGLSRSPSAMMSQRRPAAAYVARIPHSTLRWPRRSPARPNIGAIRVPKYCSAPNSVSSSTEPVSTRMYQPRISSSISIAQDVSRSAGHWKRKLRTSNGISKGERAMRVLNIRRRSRRRYRNGIAYIRPPLVHSALGPRSSFRELALPTVRS